VLPDTYMNLDKRRKLEQAEKQRAHEEELKKQAIEARKLLKSKQEQLVLRKPRKTVPDRRRLRGMQSVNIDR